MGRNGETMRDIKDGLFMAFVLGCGPVAPEGEGSGPGPSTTGVGSPTETPTTGSTSGVLPDLTEPGSISTEVGMSGSSGDSGFGFIEPDDLSDFGCDVFAQDCPVGEKCAPYADDASLSWNNLKCVPVMEDPAQVDEPCFAVGSGVSGIDNCDVGLLCWHVDENLQGMCIAMCRGTPEAPTCPPEAQCAITGNGVINLCISNCDPLIQNCPMDDDLCIPSDTKFVCAQDASGDEGQVNDPCMYADACDKGLYCIESVNAAECDQEVAGCCQPFCDLTVMDPDAQCAGVGQACVAWYEEGVAPPGYEDVGICAVPM